MDITHHKFTNTPNWEPYNIPMNQEHLLQNQTPFDHTQWPYNYLPNDPSNSSSNLPILDFKPEDQIQDLQEPQEEGGEEEEEELGAMKEMMFKIAAMQPVDIDPATIRKPRRRNVRISNDPQSVAARHRRERISEKIRILQRLVPGGTKMDTASMLDEAIRYVKFLKRQIRILQENHHPHPPCVGIPTTNAEDWAVVTTAAAAAATAAGTSYLFGNDGATGDDISYPPMCFNNKFIGD